MKRVTSESERTSRRWSLHFEHESVTHKTVQKTVKRSAYTSDKVSQKKPEMKTNQLQTMISTFYTQNLLRLCGRDLLHLVHLIHNQDFHREGFEAPVRGGNHRLDRHKLSRATGSRVGLSRYTASNQISVQKVSASSIV